MKEAFVVSKLRWALVLTAVACWVLGGTVSGQMLSPDRQTYDLGTVLDGHIGHARFTLTNTGQGSLTIASLHWGCGCIRGVRLTLSSGEEIAAHSNRTLNVTLRAGDSVELGVQFNTTGYSRRVQPTTQTLTVYYTDTTTRNLNLTVRANVVSTLPAGPDHEGSPEAFAEAHYVLIDLRPRSEFAEGHLLGAFNLPYADFEARLPQLPRGPAYVLYDHDGRQAQQAVDLMWRQGHAGQSFFISGGLVRWQSDLGNRFFIWAEGATPRTLRGSETGGTRSRSPREVADAYVVVVDISLNEAEFDRAHVPGSIHMLESEVLVWARELLASGVLATKTDLTLWILDDVGGGAACRTARRLVDDGFKARCIQGGRDALEQQTGNDVLWRNTGGR